MRNCHPDRNRAGRVNPPPSDRASKTGRPLQSGAGSLSSWVVGDPFLTVARLATRARTLIDGTGWWRTESFSLQPKVCRGFIRKVIDDLTNVVDEVASWAKQEPRAVGPALVADDIHVAFSASN